MFGDFEILKKCKTTNARVSRFTLNNNTLDLPIFMPVGTYGAIKGVPVEDLKEQMILSNTYHLRNLKKNVKNFMKWKGSMLTDSGGFQIGSLPNVEVTEEGVLFDKKLFTPEESMDIQMGLGADIIMQLDEVVNPNDPIDKIEVACKRSIRWLDRCIKQVYGSEDEENPKRVKENLPQIKLEARNQILFPIVTGGLDDSLRQYSIDEIVKRNPKGLAIGGLSGGEAKSEFARTVLYCTTHLPDSIPRYVMGVGYPEDIVICSALGTDMSDCVYPTRTARFGRMFSDTGDIYITNKLKGETKKRQDCDCFTCKNYSLAYLSMLKGTTNFCILTTIHNMHYMRNLTRRIREAILKDEYPEFIKNYMNTRYEKVPEWIVDVLKKVNVEV
ncbi:Queuine tRNA-ribosyltransferase catalytic subunit 1 [Nosema granulosis]|uniref:Queuine tRNA-ribosyltransferase catalytic subunit 1 n=1 Tax=Nosema granulosis TaxID=83296 RepID=A0A9P6GXU0_9MICR|nr:Queuine tRNA-ribosyltransferase catalytic subunit 1 [Nosema granulosis]